MRLRHIKGSEEFVASSPDTITDPEAHRGHWAEVFGSDRPLHVEIGMGKGRFIRDMSRLNPDINYVGIERYESVIQKAIERKDREEAEIGKRDNLFFVCMDAEKLAEVFAEGEVDRIYLNFSDPWPKARHEHRRLTSGRFMAVYDKVLKADGQVEFKTDNVDLFEYSLEAIPQAGWKIVYETHDLHSEDVPNVMTEYEEKFSSRGQKICKLTAVRDR